MKPTLFILAAGMGSRYGGLKQLDDLGPSGETIIDYSIYDALQAGFGKIVFVIRHSFEKEFREKVLSKYQNLVQTEIVFQEVENIPHQFEYNLKRERPWGTNHAVLMGKDVINEPFAVINSDDYYGQESFGILANFLNNVQNKKGNYCMVGYRIENTLSESGTVNRGICSTNENQYLTSITECEKIEKKGGTISFKDEKEEEKFIKQGTPVSMNMWGFTPDYFQYSENLFLDFLKDNCRSLKAEFYIPTVVDSLIRDKKATVKVLDTPAKWFGVTYAEDRPLVVMKFDELVRKGIYPKKLWEK